MRSFPRTMAQIRRLAQGVAFKATTQYEKDAAMFAWAHPKIVLGEPEIRGRLLLVWESLGRPLIGDE